MLELLDRFATKVSSISSYSVKIDIARELLRDSGNKSAVGLLMALRALHGIESFFWEPETIWLTLEKDDKTELGELARNKLQAAISLIRNPAFFWDNLVFQRSVQALNGELFDPESLQECHPAHMAWAMYEAKILRGLDPESNAQPEIDEDVQQYIAVCLQRAGYMYPPDQLQAVAENLKNLLPIEKASEVDQVKKSWEHLDKKVLPDRVFREDSRGIQLSHLASCYVYVCERADAMAIEVMALEATQT